MAEDDGYTRITLRIPNGLHEVLTQSARANSHSMNAEIVKRVQSSFARQLPGHHLHANPDFSGFTLDIVGREEIADSEEAWKELGRLSRSLSDLLDAVEKRPEILKSSKKSASVRKKDKPEHF